MVRWLKSALPGSVTMRDATRDPTRVARRRLSANGRTPLLAGFAIVLATLSATSASDLPPQSPQVEIVIAADRLGAPIAVEFIGNASRLPALVGVSDSADLEKKLRDKHYAHALRGSLRRRFAAADRIRIGNLFFGYSCAGLPFQETATRNATGSIAYQFDETIDMLELLVRAGTRPVLALTGTPRALVPDDEEPVSHSVYGCVNAPRLDLSKPEPRDRAPEWWHFQSAFFRALRERFGDKELARWEFATWTEPINKVRNPESHLVLPKGMVDAGKHEEAVATILAASIDAAMAAGVRIHIGNLAGNIGKDYPIVMARIRAFPRGPEYLDYIVGYAVSRYRTNPHQDIGRLMDGAMALRTNPDMPQKPLFIDELGQLVDDTGGRLPLGGAGLVESSFIATAILRVFEAQDGTGSAPRRIALWNTAIPPRARNVVKDANAFVPSATTNVIEFFEELNGTRKLTVSGADHDIVAGREANTVSLIALGNHHRKEKNSPWPISRSIKITGLERSKAYVVTTREVGRTQGNAVSAFIGGGSHLDDPDHRFRRDGNAWRFATKRDEQCFFDELAECSWRSKGRQMAIPKKKEMPLNTDQFGSLKMILAPDPGGAILATIEPR